MQSNRIEGTTPGETNSVRALLSSDLPELLGLLEWVDAQPEREVFAPLARSIDDLKWECRNKPAFVQTGREGETLAYCGLSPYRDGLVLEGPLCERTDPTAVLRAAVEKAREAPDRVLYAFCARANAPVRHALTGVGFEAFGGTTFYMLRRAGHAPQGAPLPEGALVVSADELSLEDYQRLYKDSDDAWSARLSWTADEYRQHFASPSVALVALGVPGPSGRVRPVAHCELELDGEEAEIAYLGVSASYRGHGWGRAVLDRGLALAFAQSGLETVTARAHDHEDNAVRLYNSRGFTLVRDIISFSQEVVT